MNWNEGFGFYFNGVVNLLEMREKKKENHFVTFDK